MLSNTNQHKYFNKVCHLAAAGGQLHIIKWARNEVNPKLPWDAEVCSMAAYRGHIDVIQWVRSQDPPCPWDERSCSNACNGSQLNLLKWLRSQNPPCPWNVNVCWSAHGKVEFKDWLNTQKLDPEWFLILNRENST